MTLYIAFLLLALTQAQAQAQVSELKDMYYTDKTLATSFTDGAWYMIFTNSDATDYLREKADHKGIEAITGSTTISFPTVGSLATEGNMPYMLFKAEGDDTRGYTLKSGNGNYIVVKVTRWDAASVSVSNSKSTRMAIGAIGSIGSESTSYVTIRSKNTLYNGYYYSYYGYLNASAGATPSISYDANNYPLYLYKVSLVEMHKVTYKYMYNGTLLDSVQSAPLAIGDPYPAVTLPQALVKANYELDPSDKSKWPNGKIGNFDTLEYKIQVRPKATAKEQIVTVTPNTEAQTGQTLDLTTLVSSNASNPDFYFTLTTDGGTGSTLDNQTLETGDKEGEVKMTVKGKEVGSSSDPENWYAASAEQTFTITVKSVPSYVSEFCKAYEKLAAYRGNIGKGLGLYTLKATEGGTTYDNEAYLSTLALYSPMYADPTGSSESALKEASLHVKDLTTVLEAKDTYGKYQNLSLNMPQDGTLLRISNADVSGYLTPTGDTPSLEAKSVGKSSTPSADNIFYYYATGEGGKCSLLSYRNGLFLSLSNTETQLTEVKDVIEFSAYSMAILDGRYAMAGVPDKAFLLEEVDVLPVTISQYEWATLYTPVALTIPGNLHAYVETSDAPIGGKIPVKRIIGTVPPRTALILNGPQGEYSFKVAHRLSTESGPNKFLTGTFPLVSTSTLGTNVMTLQPKADAAGFYKWTKPIVTHFKVYHTTAASSESKGYALSFDTEDSIGGIGGEEEAIQAIYTLQGNALRHYPTRGGLYIVNGKKVLIR